MPKKLPENEEARYQLRLQRGNMENPASHHSPRDAYIDKATQEVIKWTYSTLPRNEFDRIHEKHIREICILQDDKELNGNMSEFREAWDDVRAKKDDYVYTHGSNPPGALVQDWVATAMEPIAHLPVKVPDSYLRNRWSRPIRYVSDSEVDRMAELRDINLRRAGIGRRQIQTAQDCLDIVVASPAMTLGQAFNF